MAFREVPMFEVREVLRLWLGGEGLRAVARLGRVDRKTVVRGHENVPGGGQVWSPLVAVSSPRWWPAEVSTSH